MNSFRKIRFCLIFSFLISSISIFTSDIAYGGFLDDLKRNALKILKNVEQEIGKTAEKAADRVDDERSQSIDYSRVSDRLDFNDPEVRKAQALMVAHFYWTNEILNYSRGPLDNSSFVTLLGGEYDCDGAFHAAQFEPDMDAFAEKWRPQILRDAANAKQSIIGKKIILETNPFLIGGKYGKANFQYDSAAGGLLIKLGEIATLTLIKTNSDLIKRNPDQRQWPNCYRLEKGRYNTQKKVWLNRQLPVPTVAGQWRLPDRKLDLANVLPLVYLEGEKPPGYGSPKKSKFSLITIDINRARQLTTTNEKMYVRAWMRIKKVTVSEINGTKMKVAVDLDGPLSGLEAVFVDKKGRETVVPIPIQQQQQLAATSSAPSAAQNLNYDKVINLGALGRHPAFIPLNTTIRQNGSVLMSIEEERFLSRDSIRFLNLIHFAENPVLTDQNVIKMIRDNLNLKGISQYCTLPGRISLNRITWRGSGEFEKRDSKQAFFAEFAPLFKGISVNYPFNVEFILKVIMSSYNFDKGGFMVTRSDGVSALGPFFNNNIISMTHKLTDADNRLGLWQISPEQARTLVKRLEPEYGGYKVIYRLTLEVRGVGEYKYEHQFDLLSELVSAEIFLDKDLNEKVHDFQIMKANKLADAQREQEAKEAIEEWEAKEKRESVKAAAEAAAEAEERRKIADAQRKIADAQRKQEDMFKKCAALATAEERLQCLKNLEESGLLKDTLDNRLKVRRAISKAKKQIKDDKYEAQEKEVEAQRREVEARRMAQKYMSVELWAPRQGTEEYEAALAACIKAPKREAYGPDIVGLRLGMEKNEAQDIVRKQMKSYNYVMLNNKKTRPFEGGTLSYTDDASRGIALFSIKNHGKYLVAAVSRRVYFGDKGATKYQITEGLRKKYGTETWRDGKKTMVWTFPTGSEHLSTKEYSGLVELIVPRDNWEGSWILRLTDQERTQAMQKKQAEVDAKWKAYDKCTMEATMKAEPYSHNDAKYMKIYNKEMEICKERYDPYSQTQNTEETRLPLMIGPEGSPETYAKYKKCGPVVIVLLNTDAEGMVMDASFVLFDPSWIAEQPAFAFKSKKSDSKVMIDF